MNNVNVKKFSKIHFPRMLYENFDETGLLFLYKSGLQMTIMQMKHGHCCRKLRNKQISNNCGCVIQNLKVRQREDQGLFFHTFLWIVRGGVPSFGRDVNNDRDTTFYWMQKLSKKRLNFDSLN